MTIPLMNQIQSAEYGLNPVDRTADPRFVPAPRLSLRTSGARLIRSSANQGLRLADRLEGHYQPA
ncbi:MAG: hypothetical protein CVT65_03230 [Actinobacteria bacterium HGW-Actinobacteria-5]|jgi:hypothetical protein|nr:MAG: hypothetical protein CVT65_03230 [Actinobacteria bacterium HGW-Actinobacteria-5]